jgi:hypothetical protein
MSFRFTALAPVRCGLLVACGGQRITAGERDDRRSNHTKQDPLPPSPSANQVPTIENGAATLICVRRVNGPDPFLLEKYAVN